MVALTQEEKDVVARFQKLPPERQWQVMLVMLGTGPDRWKHYQKEGEQQLRRLATERGLDWDVLDDEQRENFVDALFHEGRS